ncbi:MAG TPA: hypothetical protein VFY79_05505, partial [Dehalococcoidia bacterium]|nr:hypothetical protein [Dehalococcoidia bacterium]
MSRNRGYLQLPDDGAQPDRSVAKLGVGLLLFFALLALSAVLALYQLTSRDTARDALRRSVAALTEIDALIDRNYATMQQQAAVTAPGDSVQLPGYPVDVPLKPADAQSLSKEQLRDTLLDRSADIMYGHGTSALRSQTKDAGSVGVFSIGGLTDHGLDFLRSRNHDILRVLTLVLAAVSAVLALLLALLCRGFGRLVAVGIVTLAAALPVLFFGLAAWLYLRANDSGEYTRQQFASLGA